MKICIHRGSKEIGGSCVELTSKGQRLVIDLGLPLDAEGEAEKYLPNIPGLDGRDKSLLAILISHPHLDHFGLLSHISNKVPIIMGEAGRRILKAAVPFLPGNWPTIADGTTISNGKTIEVGPFKITPYLVDHSAYDAYSFLIEADDKRIFYSGDFRAHGRKAKLTDAIISNPPKNVDLLLLEGSTLGRLETNSSFPTEEEIENRLEETFNAAKGLALVHGSAQNIDRVVSIFRACKKAGRRLVIDLYNSVIFEATGNNSIPKSDWPEVAVYIPQYQRVKIKNNKWFDLLERHSRNRIFIEEFKEIGSKAVLLFRPLHMTSIEKAGLTKDAVYVYSQYSGYWEEDSFSDVREWIAKHNIPKINIHTSGHASVPDLIRFAEAIAPKKTVPIHTFFPEQYNVLFKNVEQHTDGVEWEI